VLPNTWILTRTWSLLFGDFENEIIQNFLNEEDEEIEEIEENEVERREVITKEKFRAYLEGMKLQYCIRQFYRPLGNWRKYFWTACSNQISKEKLQKF
jgi:hypothetical protein